MRIHNAEPILKLALDRGSEHASEIEALTNECVDGLSWNEVSNPDFVLSKEHEEAALKLKNFLIERGIATEKELTVICT